MPELAEWLLEFIGGATVSAGLVAVAGWLSRHQIAHWLTRDLERQKHQYSRELEAYKVQLVAEVERIKAANDVRKTGALKVLDKKYDGLHRLHLAINGLASSTLFCASLPFQSRTPDQRQRVLDNIEELNAALHSVSPFLALEERKSLNEYREQILGLLKYVAGPNSLTGAELDVFTANLVSSELRVDKLVQEKLFEMMRLE